jgi:hypothetical protein
MVLGVPHLRTFTFETRIAGQERTFNGSRAVADMDRLHQYSGGEESIFESFLLPDLQRIPIGCLE